MEDNTQTELLLRLPVALGTPAWLVHENPACHQGVKDAEHFLFGKVITPRYTISPVTFHFPMLESWGKTIFASEAEGRKIIEEVCRCCGD